LELARPARLIATQPRLRRGVFRGVADLILAIKEYIAVHNQEPKPFVWTAKANHILQKVIRANRRLGSKKSEALQWRDAGGDRALLRAGDLRCLDHRGSSLLLSKIKRTYGCPL
jgi:hypothetical protein